MAHYDMLVIGSGPAGQKAAIQASKLCKRVAIIERREEVGGVAINTGTIPSKSLREAAIYLSGIRQRTLYGASYRVKKKITMSDLSFRTNHVIRQEIEVTNDQLARNYVDVINGTGQLIGKQRVAVRQGNKIVEHTAKFIVIAVGTVPARPANIPFDESSIIDTDGLLNLKRLPLSITIVGGGVIGCEYATILGALGLQVVLVDKRPRLLEFADAEIIEALQYHIRNNNVTLRLGEEVTKVTRDPNKRVRLHLKSGKQIATSTLLYSIGRQGASDALNLKAVGIKPDARGRIAVNEHYQTKVPNIYAVGDIIGFPALASTSMQQGRYAACHAFRAPIKHEDRLLPFGIYTIPEISMVGPTEQTLTEQGVPYEVGIARYREIARGQLIGDETGLLKLLFNRKNRKLLAVHVIGEGATELVHIGQAVMAHGGKIEYFADIVLNYPTLAEAYRIAALAGLNRLA